jgi:hypothetical protein
MGVNTDSYYIRLSLSSTKLFASSQDNHGFINRTITL